MKNHRLSLVYALITIVLMLGASVACTEVSARGPMFSGDDWIPGTGQVTEQTHPVSSVSGLIFEGVGIVHLQQGGFEQLRVRAEEQVHERLRIEMQGGNLMIGFQPGTSVQNSSAIEFFLTVSDLSRIEMSGVGSIQANSLSAGDLTLIKHGLGDIELLGLNANRVDVTKSGLGAVRLAGQATRQFLSLEGMGDYNATGLQTQEAYLTLRDSSSARVQVSDRLDAAIHGSGSVYYYGNPAITRTGSGSGSVVAL